MIPRIALAVAGIGLGLLVAEASLAWLAPQVRRLPDAWEHDPRLGWRHVPGARGRLVSPEFDVEYRIDADGRRSHRARRDEAELPAVLLFGDSFAEGWGVEVEEGVAASLAGSLAEAGRPVRVHNLGVAGYGTDQALLRFEAEGAKMTPRMVILLFYPNDLWNNVSDRDIGAQRGRKPTFQVDAGRLRLTGTPVPPLPPETMRLGRYLVQRWHVAALVAQAWPSPPASTAQARQYYGALYGLEESASPLWDVTERLLSTFAAAVARAGGRFVLVSAPTIVQIDADDWRSKRDRHDLTGAYDLRRPNERLASIATRHDLEFLDLVPAFVEASSSQRLYFQDSHWTPAGHRLAASEIAAYVLARQLLQGAVSR